MPSGTSGEASGGCTAGADCAPGGVIENNLGDLQLGPSNLVDDPEFVGAATEDYPCGGQPAHGDLAARPVEQ